MGALPTRALGMGGVARRVGAFAVRRPGLAGIALGGLMSLPALFRGAQAAMAPSSFEFPEVGMAPHNIQYGMDPNNLNTMGLTLSMHYGR